jgi:hypothetical protein
VNRRVLEVAGVVMLLALLARPMVIGRTFVGWDWYSHQWYIWHQAGSLKATGLPSLFAHDPSAVFISHYAFYGGTLYTLAGVVTVIVGDAGTAMVLVLIGAFAAAYAGWFWLARQAGVTTWAAHAPAVLFVTAPYYLAMVYSTGGFAEFIAISMIPLLIASTFAVLRAERLRAGPAALLAISAMLFTGSHNIALLWGSTVLAILGVALFAVIPALRRTLSRRGVTRVALIAVPAVMVNGWFLLPDVVYQSHTNIAAFTEMAKEQLGIAMYLVQPSKLWSLGRATAWPNVPHHALQLPVLGFAWILVGLALARASWRTSWFRGVLVLVAAIAALYLLMTRFSLLWGLPKPYNNVQFSYRLESYILLAFAGAVVGVLALMGRPSRRRTLWTWALVPVMAWAVAGAGWQLRQQPPATQPEWTQAAPYHTAAGVPNVGQYGSSDLEILPIAPGLPIARFSATDAERDRRAEATVDASPGMIVRTNVVAPPELVTLKGGRFVGREQPGQVLVELGSDATPGAAKLTIAPAHPWPVVGGWILTLLGLVGLAVNAVMIRRRRARP